MRNSAMRALWNSASEGNAGKISPLKGPYVRKQGNPHQIAMARGVRQYLMKCRVWAILGP